MSNAVDAPRAVPSDIAEYEKFVAAEATAAANAKPSEAADKADETDSDSETENPGKKKSGFQRRVTRLNRQIGERDARIKELEKQVEQRGASGATADSRPTPEAKAPEQQAEKPKLEDFDDWNKFNEALIDWTTEQKLAKAAEASQTKKQETAAAQAGQAVMEAHNTRVDEARERYTDWEKAFKGLSDEAFSQAMFVSIVESEVGPDVSYFLATNRDELARIGKLSPIRQAAEIGKIEARVVKAAAEAEDDADEETAKVEPKPKTRAVSQAPPPAKPLKGKGTAEDAMPDPKDFAAYEAWSRRKAAAANRN